MSPRPSRAPSPLAIVFLPILILGMAASAAPPLLAAAAGPAPPLYDLILRGGRIVDGTGAPWFEGDVAIRGDRIVAIGRLERAAAKRTIDVRGLVVAPGFIDMLGQSELTVLVDPHVRSKITQGITTELTGEGGSVAPQTAFTIEQLVPTIADLNLTIDWRDYDGYFGRLRQKGSAVNFAHLVGAAQVREAVMKSDNRAPTQEELERMKRLVARAMEQGAVGLSTALIYPPGTFAETRELVELAKVASGYGGFYASHIRNESNRLVKALEEAASIGEQAKIPVEVWHFKSAGRSNWGRIGDGIKAIEAARARGVDITADMYPYPASSTDLTACLPPRAQEGGLQALVARLKDPAERARIRGEIESAEVEWENVWAQTGPDNILIVGVKKAANRKWQGKRLAEIAKERGVDPFEAMFDLLVDENGTVSCVYFEMSEDDVREAMAQPWVAFDCDAGGVRPDGVLGAEMTHPRAYGTFPRILGRYVREEKILKLEDAVRKMTSLAARRIGLWDRGILRPGLYADITVFDPQKVADRATFDAPHQYSEGIVHVFVNGQPVVENGKVTDRLPGRVLRREPPHRPS
ncbi:MAG TPA: D-aminoacylase [Candidatus Polarisedimenticolia bacterium]|nr:D-aminoacylase [Candidatus Polarisedimenticolia bacterium]